MANLAEDLKDYGREYEEQKKFGPELTELMRQGEIGQRQDRSSPVVARAAQVGRRAGSGGME